MRLTTFDKGFLMKQFLALGAVSLLSLTAVNAFAADGKAIYTQTCQACHATGVANAPKLGDKAAWAPRLAAGTDALVAAVLKGKNAMPPKGGNANLSEADVKAAVDFLIAQAK